MPRSLAEGHKKVSIMAVKPANLAAPTVAELNAGIDASCRILESDFKLGPAGSDTVDEKSLCDIGTSETPTNQKFEGMLTVFRYFSAGKAEVAGTGGVVGDALFQALKVLGTEVYIAVRETSKLATDAWAATDEVDVFHVFTDAPQRGDGTGFIKRMIPLFVQGDSVINGTVAAGA